MKYCKIEPDIEKDIQLIKEKLRERDVSQPIGSKDELYGIYEAQGIINAINIDGEVRMATLVVFWNHSKRNERLLILKEYFEISMTEAEAGMQIFYV